MNGRHRDGHVTLVLAPSSLSRSEIGLKRPVLCLEKIFCITFRVERHSRWAENGLKVILLF